MRGFAERGYHLSVAWREAVCPPAIARTVQPAVATVRVHHQEVCTVQARVVPRGLGLPPVRGKALMPKAHRSDLDMTSAGQGSHAGIPIACQAVIQMMTGKPGCYLDVLGWDCWLDSIVRQGQAIAKQGREQQWSQPGSGEPVSQQAPGENGREWQDGGHLAPGLRSLRGRAEHVACPVEQDRKGQDACH